MREYSLEKYVESVKNFVNDTKKWNGLDEYNFYTSDDFGNWIESSDNANGGLDLSWAFQKDPNFDEIRRHFIDLIKEELEFLIQNDVKKIDVTIKNND